MEKTNAQNDSFQIESERPVYLTQTEELNRIDQLIQQILTMLEHEDE